MHRDSDIPILSFLFCHLQFPSSFCHPHFSIRHPASAAIRSALYRDPLQRSLISGIQRMVTQEREESLPWNVAMPTVQYIIPHIHVARNFYHVDMTQKE